ncbi:MAG: hypothetical protein WC107_01485 [Patescibacteria group bacterium]
MNNFFRQPVVLILFVVAILIAFGWNFISKRQEAKKTAQTQTNINTNAYSPSVVSNLTNLDPTDFDSSVRQQYALAVEKATLQNPNNALSAIEVSIDDSMTADRTSLRYIFSAANDTSNNWMITVLQKDNSYSRALVPKEDYAGNLATVDTKLWKYNYVTALQLAEKAGGLKWREENTLLELRLTLKTIPQKGWLVWVVEYKGQNSNYVITLDASSGKQITE